jgi:GTP cyclohydrolase II
VSAPLTPRQALQRRAQALDAAAQGVPDAIRIAAVADLPTRFGDFCIVAFHDPLDTSGREHVALVHGLVEGVQDVPVRLHSECLTGDALGSLRCDCRDQLEAALRLLSSGPCGALLYLRQEGRGIGLANKIKAYALQDTGLDTVDANLRLGFRDDERSYTTAARMLRALGVVSVQLLTNNPLKIAALEASGVRVSGRRKLLIGVNAVNRGYLETKAIRMGHLYDARSVAAAAAQA